MNAETVRVNLGPRGYDIVIASNHLAGVGPFARASVSRDTLASAQTLAVVVVDENVRLHADAVSLALAEAGFRTNSVVLPSGEATKSQATIALLWDRLAELHADRRTLVVAVGGGVIGDAAGFAAATFNRGLPLLMVPTTLLSMVDSSVGGKVGINHPKAKNLIGAFHQPVGVWIDTATLDTMPPREFCSGLAEVVKYGVILDPEFFQYQEANADRILAREPVAIRHVVAQSCRLKADVVAKDEREETGLRAVLNYGHTFAHAFETAAGYGRWLHGEAVAAGMVCASRLAERLGLIPAELTERQRRLLQKFQLPVAPEPWPIDALIATMRSDKKSLAGKLRFILPRRLGEVALFDNAREDDVRGVLQELTTAAK